VQDRHPTSLRQSPSTRRHLLLSRVFEHEAALADKEITGRFPFYFPSQTPRTPVRRNPSLFLAFSKTAPTTDSPPSAAVQIHLVFSICPFGRHALCGSNGVSMQFLHFPLFSLPALLNYLDLSSLGMVVSISSSRSYLGVPLWFFPRRDLLKRVLFSPRWLSVSIVPSLLQVRSFRSCRWLVPGIFLVIRWGTGHSANP